MSGIRKSCLAAMAFGLVWLAGMGCQRVAPLPPQAAGPMIGTDEIGQTRADWPKTVSHMANGDVVAGPSGVVFKPAGSECTQGLMDVPVFLGNTILLPWTLLSSPASQSHSGVQYEPTYTAIAARP